MADRELPSGRVTLLFSDVEGSTRLIDELGEKGYVQALIEHRRLLRATFSAHGGVEVDTQGDAFLYAFRDPREAVAAAAQGQQALSAGPVKVRIGLHTGNVRLTGEGYAGRELHRAARIAASGHGGQVVLSAATRALVDGNVSELGEHRLKDFPEPIALFQLGSERFPPLKTISNTNLPRPASSFIGRERETAEVAELARESRLVTLTGPGGSGKTRLAIEAAAELVGAFKAGVFWVPLAAIRDPRAVVGTVSQTLGAKDGLAEHIGEGELLLLLDNLEQVIDAAPELATLVESCPNLHLVVTSRELLRVRGEVEYPVPPLADHEAVTLFSERSHLEPDEPTGELCRRLDNLPLAVELAAARTSVLSPAQILDRLSHRLDVLKGGRDTETRQQTLRATIEWSHDLLEERDQQLFARLGVFSGGFTLAAAEEVADADLDVVQSLVDKSLVRHTSARFWMLETIREYALEQLEESSDAAHIRRRYADHYLSFAEEACASTNEFVTDRVWLDRLEREHDNLRAVLAWLEAAGETQQVLELTGALANFWGARGFIAEGFRRLERALAQDEAPTAPRARALNAAADLGGLGRGDPAAAVHWGEQGLALHRALGNRWGAANALFLLAHAACDRRDFERARELVEESRTLFEEVGDERWAAAATWILGWAHSGLGNLERSIACYETALERARAADLPTLRSLALYSLSGKLLNAGQARAALTLASEAYEVDRSQGDRWRLSLTACRLASILAALDQPASAALAYSAGTASLEEMGGVPLHRAEEDKRTWERLHEVLGDSFEEHWQAGRKVSLEDALELALAD
jgi:predicted ATPase